MAIRCLTPTSATAAATVLCHNHSCIDQHKYFFTQRVIKPWNNLQITLNDWSSVAKFKSNCFVILAVARSFSVSVLSMFGTVYLIQLISPLWLLLKGPLLILISLIFWRFFLSNFFYCLVSLVTCHITLFFFLRAVVSAISAFLTLDTHCPHIYHISITFCCAVCVSQ